MRKPKREKTAIIHLLKSVWAETRGGKEIQNFQQAEVVMAIVCTLGYLEIYDMLRNENHKTYFIKMFLSFRNNLTQSRLGMACGICVDTVSDYCKSYIEIFTYYLSWVRELRVSFEKIENLNSLIEAMSLRAVQLRKK